MTIAIPIAIAALLVVACGDDVQPPLSVAQLQQPVTCTSCHADHSRQWSGSMHAYASVDPIFRALHKRGQRETGGALGLFCVRCHAPMAVENGTITEANVATFDFDTLTPAETGVTCYFCHNVKEVVADENNGLVIAHDQTMRGGAMNPVANPVHDSAYSPLMDGTKLDSSPMCGGCHDVRNGNGVLIEDTFADWKRTMFATDPRAAQSCAGCHMEASDGVIADAPGLGVTTRIAGLHDHFMAAVDEALVPFPESDAHAIALAEQLSGAVAIQGTIPPGERRPIGGICLDPPGELRVRIEPFAGHSVPSGAAFDRRMWLEVIATDVNGQVVFQTGVVPDDKDPDEVEATDSNLLGFWRRALTPGAGSAHFFWEIGAFVDDDRHLLSPAIELGLDHSTRAVFRNVPSYTTIEKIVARVRLRALPLELLRLLEASGDLAPGFAAKLETYDLSVSVWDKSTKGTGIAINTNCNLR